MSTLANASTAVTMATAAVMLETYMDANIPAFVWGAAGIGKSDMVRGVAAKRGGGFIDFRPALRDPVDLRGIPVADQGRTRWLAPDDLPRVDRDGETGTLFMDELPHAQNSMQNACFGLVLDRRVGDYILPPGWRVVAAGNRLQDRAGANAINTALANRFAHIDCKACPDAWQAWALTADVSPMVRAFLRLRPQLLHVPPATREQMAFPTPRAWGSVAKLVRVPESIRLAMVAGLVGHDAGAEFEAFARTWTRLPSPDAILRDPDTTPVPSDPGALYALATGLAAMAKRDTFAAVIRYMERAGAEFSVLCVTDAIRRDGTLQETPAFAAWASRNAHVTI